jgi:hypothetical protein
MARLTDAYTSPPQLGSGVDWDTLFKVVVDRYAERLEIARYTLNNTDGANALVTAKSLMAQLRVMLAPYILHSAVPSADSDGRAWAAPVFELCATTHTGYIRRSPSLAARLTAAETLLLDAVDATQHEICRVVVGMWADGAAAGLDDFLPVDDPVDTDVAALTQRWKGAVDDLMAWLDWSVWIKCRPGCGFEVWPTSFQCHLAHLRFCRKCVIYRRGRLCLARVADGVTALAILLPVLPYAQPFRKMTVT